MPLPQVIEALLASPLKRVFVVNAQQQIQGVISDVDVLNRLQTSERKSFVGLLQNWTRGRRPQRLSSGALHVLTGKPQVASDVMNPEVITVNDTTSVQETIECMMKKRREFLPVTDRQQCIQGVVGRSDILRFLLER
ncbi:HPP family protein [Ktedonospora formicarum]|uniref:CBS domain-containing protein n=1 Tax=Ktedonospora formicarum TaxID=2778364 RepID=A0A8J3MV25_9CHLR|nr:CBS domain-containing protein [Ktedonospora formicarum]GHO46040.1 hypothetical protein KSX_42030 [Ktedonospora formicarum]